MYYLFKSSFSKGRKQGCQQSTICVCLFLTIFVYLIPLVTKKAKRQKMLNLEKGAVALSPLTCIPVRFRQFLWVIVPGQMTSVISRGPPCLCYFYFSRWFAINHL